jgi:hypothetical protein
VAKSDVMNVWMPRRKFLAWLGLTALAAGSAALGGPEKSTFDSTSLAGASYDRQARLLELEFRTGAIYRYREVPPEIHAGLLRAASKGRYFTQHIRGRFAFEKIRAKR